MPAPRDSNTISSKLDALPGRDGGTAGSKPADPGNKAKLVLVVDDDPTFRMVAQASLEAGGFKVAEAENGREGVDAFKKLRPDIVLLDIRMPVMDGYETCAALRTLPEGRKTPIVVLTGLHDPDSVENAYAAGATDFISKPVNYAILNHRLQQILSANRFDGEFDELTGLPTRALVRNHVGRAVAMGRRTQSAVAILFVDLDNFKALNEEKGDRIGDEVLRQVANRLGDIRSTDYLGRNCDAGVQHLKSATRSVAGLGGDEFVLVLPDMLDVEDSTIVARRIGDFLSRPFRIGSEDIQVTASIGISAFPMDGEESLTLLTRAEVAMKHAREKGGAGYEFFQERLNAKAQRSVALERDLRGILDRSELQVHYQPRVDIQQNRIAGVEALARWPEALERVGPEEFVPVADKSGLGPQLGEAVLRMACGHLMEMMRKGLPSLGVSVNVSLSQLQQRGVAAQLKRIASQAHIDPALVELEIAETTLLKDPEHFEARLKDLRDAGFRIALDAFGTGVSSLNTLSRFPIDTLKIDRTCVAELGKRSGHSIAEAISKLGSALSLKVVAVGVEEPRQLDKLREQGCHEVQGFLLSRPVAFDRFLEWASDWEARADAPVMDTVAASLRGSDGDR